MKRRTNADRMKQRTMEITTAAAVPAAAVAVAVAVYRLLYIVLLPPIKMRLSVSFPLLLPLLLLRLLPSPSPPSHLNRVLFQVQAGITSLCFFAVFLFLFSFVSMRSLVRVSPHSLRLCFHLSHFSSKN